MLEVGEVVLENGNDIGLGRVLTGKHRAQRREYCLNFGDRTLLGIFDRSKIDEGCLVFDVGIRVKLLKRLLATRIASKEFTRII